MATTAIDIAGKACILAKIRPINSFSDNTTEAIALDENYEDIVRNELMEYSYKFAKKQWQLIRKADAPLARWDAAYAIPADVIAIDTVLVNDTPISYDMYVGEIYCNAAEDDDVILEGVVRVDENDWPSNFITLVKYRLAEMLADSVAQKPTMAKRFADKAEFLQAKTKNRNSQSVTSRRLKVTRITNRRHG